MTHPADTTVRYEPCATFREGDDPLVCGCGWLEDDHAPTEALAAIAAVVVIGARRRPTVTLPARRAS